MRTMLISISTFAAACLLAPLFAHNSVLTPPVIRIAHMGYYMSDLNRSRAYYHDFLGFDEAVTLNTSGGSDPIAFFKINDNQYIELFQEAPRNYGFIHDIAFQTDNAGRTRAYLAAHGIKVPAPIGNDEAGNRCFDITDPSGYTVRMIQYEPESLTGRTRGKFMPDRRISTHIDHIGVLNKDKEAAANFYATILGSENTGENKLLVGNGPDRFEIGFERKARTPTRYHIKNHICLSAPDVPKLVAMLKAKPDYKQFREIETHLLPNGKHVAELYDPDGNRIEIMEPPKEQRAVEK
jgi:catechol 2,3-dioxygenase-like lactoylglutathione lyase family enzyme